MITLNRKHTDPLRPESVYTGSAYTATVAGVPREIYGFTVTGVTFYVTNADGTQYTASATRDGRLWSATFAASCFSNYGFVSRGLKVDVTGTDEDEVTRTWTAGVGDFEVVAATASATPGTGGNYVVKGAECYLRSQVVDGTQHFVKQSMSYDSEMAAWGATWTGDYILSASGEFVEANGSDEDE